MNSLTPYELSLLIHFHIRPVKYGSPHSDLYSDACQLFLKLGVIDSNDTCESGFETTALGTAWIDSILKTPIPTTAFIDAEGNVI